MQHGLRRAHVQRAFKLIQLNWVRNSFFFLRQSDALVSLRHAMGTSATTERYNVYDKTITNEKKIFFFFFYSFCFKFPASRGTARFSTIRRCETHHSVLIDQLFSSLSSGFTFVFIEAFPFLAVQLPISFSLSLLNLNESWHLRILSLCANDRKTFFLQKTTEKIVDSHQNNQIECDAHCT